MKIISLLASPHGLKGNTAGLLRHVLDGAESEGAQSEIIVLKGDTVLPCIACDVCHKKGGCIQKDDFESIKERIMEADGLVIASPNYIFNVSAQLKAFMDRCCGAIHIMEFWGKYGASVVTSGGGDEKTILDYMNHFLAISGAVPVGGVSATMALLPDSIFTESIRKDARTLGVRLVKAFRAQKVPPEVDEVRRNFRDRMRGLVDYRKDEWPYEYVYWEKRSAG
jgi:multimeric flavodoxin WrbA